MRHWVSLVLAQLLLYLGVLTAGLLPTCGAEESSQPFPPSAEAALAQRLVQQLGDADFANRERASAQLIQLGLPAQAALLQGRRHADREIRYRSARILSIIREEDFLRRLEAFVSGENADHDYDLPGWSLFRQRHGDQPDLRALFVQMQKSEPELLQALEEGPKAASNLLNLRSEQLQHALRFYRNQVTLGSIASLLFVASDERVVVSPLAGTTIYSYCHQAVFRSAVSSGSRKDALRKMLGAWVQRANDATSYQSLHLAMTHGLKEGLIPAEKCIRDPNSPVHIRQYAILTIAKLGDESHIELLETMMEDDTRCSSQRVQNLTYETQIRDVALAAVIHLMDEDHLKFGFDARLQRNATVVFNTSTLGFSGDKQRDKALARWRQYRAQHLRAKTD